MQKRSGVQPYDTIPYHTVPYHTIPYHTIRYDTIPYHTISSYRTCAWTDDLGPEIRVYRACYAHCITPLVNDTKMSGTVIYRIESMTIIMCVCVCMYVCVCVCVCVCERLCNRKRGRQNQSEKGVTK